VTAWHPSYGELVAAVSCPVCGAPAGTWCAGDPRDIHVDRILLARGVTP
jgi:hypothetical protein